MSTDVVNNPASNEHSKKPQVCRQFGKKPEGEKRDGIPIFKYRKGSNFHAFQQAMSSKALREFIDLRTLISMSKYYIPKLEVPDYSELKLSEDEGGLI